MNQMGTPLKVAIAAGLLFPLALFCGVLMIVGALFGDEEDQNASLPPESVASAGGCGLKPGSVPNGWEAEVVAAAQAAGIPPARAAAQLKQESGWNPNVLGPPTRYGQAKGLAQFIDSTWASYGNGSPFDPIQAIRAYGAYMARLMADMQPIAQATGVPVVDLAQAAYNAGPGAVQKYNGVPPFDETQNYLVRIKEYASEFEAVCVWTHPLPGAVLTSRYGPRDGHMHAGIDIATPRDQPPGTEVAITSMKITFAGCSGDGYGCSVVGEATDGTGYMFRYGHIAVGTIRVTVGQEVTAGTPLGVMGNTGDSNGAHLHFEIYLPGHPPNAYASSGKSTDPLPILAAQGIQI